MTHKSTLIVLVMAALNRGVLFGAQQLARQPLFRVTDLNVGESQLLKLSDGSQANVKLLRIEETRDALRSALRLARVKVEARLNPIAPHAANPRQALRGKRRLHK